MKTNLVWESALPGPFARPQCLYRMDGSRALEGNAMFDYTEAMECLSRHIVAHCPEFAHVDMDRVVVASIRTRSPGARGVYASVMPLRFMGGATTMTRRGRTYSMPEVRIGDTEMLYLVYFALPRFADLDFRTKITTVFHELYHIGPGFDGDIRRFPGRNYAHGHSRKKYNESMEKLADEYLALPESELPTNFLEMSFKELETRYGRIGGRRVRPPRPKLCSG